MGEGAPGLPLHFLWYYPVRSTLAVMETNLIWCIGASLEAVVLIRGALTGLLRRYPLFYVYITCVLLKGVIALWSYAFAPDLYQSLYWITELATIVVSYGVIVEIFRAGLKHNPGIANKSQKLLLSVFALTLGYAATDLLHGRFASAARGIVELGRDLRYIEGALLLVMLWLFIHYRISLGRNLLGLIGGYSFWVGLNVVNLMLWFLPGNGSSVLLRRLLPITYVATLAIWCLALWSCQSEAAKPPEGAIERDYEFLATKTRTILARTSHLLRVLRP